MASLRRTLFAAPLSLLLALAGPAIAADPVLVNTDLRAHLRDELPAPTAFDHVVVRPG